MIRYSLAACGCVLGGVASAEVPNVAADIAPVHSLVAVVMEGVGSPDLIVRPGASPHGYSMRPSEARALQDADAVFWIGESLTPWLTKPLETLGEGSVQIELLEVEGNVLFEYRDSHDHDEDEHDDHDKHDDHDEHGHKDHDDHDDHAEDKGHDDHDHEEHAEDDKHDDHEDHADGHDDHADGHDDHADGHDDHADGHDDHDHHDHEGADAHAWLDPENARLWLSVIADQLAELDPENADRYQANAAAAREALAGQITRLQADLAPMQGKPFIAFHDAFQYFEQRFGLSLTGTVAIGDASDPSPARLAHLREEIIEHKVACAFSEPQYNVGLIEAAIEGSEAVIYTIDPLGAGLEPGAPLYTKLLDDMATSFAECATRY